MAARGTQTKNTKVVQCTRGTYEVSIGRPSQWGNRFVIGQDGTREHVIQQYRNWFMTQPSLLAALPELKGRTLGCWCAPAACHGDVLAELADAGLSQRSRSATATPLARHYGGIRIFPSHESGVKGIQKGFLYA
jgi:Domain of unknown function (DUF4326)